MLRRMSVLVGLAVLLSLVFPLKAWLKQGGVDAALGMPDLELAVVCVLLAIPPALVLFHDTQLARRIPRWNIWVALLASCSLLFLLLHFGWTVEVARSYASEALPLAISPHALLHGLDLAARLGVLVSLVGVLVNLESVPGDEPPAKRRKQ